MPQRNHSTNQSFSRRQGPRPNRSWTGFNNGVGVAVGAGTKVLVARFPLANVGIDETLLRIRGSFVAYSTTLSADVIISGAVGIGVFSSIAGIAGAASLPGPTTDAGTDVWALWEPITTFMDSSGAAAGTQAFERQVIDSRAKRIVPNGYELVMMVEAEAGISFTLMTELRILSMVRGT